MSSKNFCEDKEEQTCEQEIKEAKGPPEEAEQAGCTSKQAGPQEQVEDRMMSWTVNFLYK